MKKNRAQAMAAMASDLNEAAAGATEVAFTEVPEIHGATEVSQTAMETAMAEAKEKAGASTPEVNPEVKPSSEETEMGKMMEELGKSMGKEEATMKKIVADNVKMFEDMKILVASATLSAKEAKEAALAAEKEVALAVQHAKAAEASAVVVEVQGTEVSKGLLEMRAQIALNKRYKQEVVSENFGWIDAAVVVATVVIASTTGTLIKNKLKTGNFLGAPALPPGDYSLKVA